MRRAALAGRLNTWFAIACVASLASVSAHAGPAPVVRKLANGLEVAVIPDHRIPIVYIQIAVPVGAAQDPSGENGLAFLTAALLLHGTSSRTPTAFATAVQQLGGVVTSGAGREVSTLSGTFLARDFDPGLELVADALVNPLFRRGEAGRLRSDLVEAAARARVDPGLAADQHLWGLLLGGHPYGAPLVGTPPTAQIISRTDAQEFHRQWYRPEGVRIAICGDVDVDSAFTTVASQLGSWAGRPPQRAVPGFSDAPRQRTRIRLVDEPDAPRIEIRMGWVGPPQGSPDADALSVLEQILAGGPESRLGKALGPGIRSGFSSLQRGGVLALGVATHGDSVASAIDHMRSEMMRLMVEPPGAAEVAAARDRVRGALTLARESLASQAAAWINSSLYGLPADYAERASERAGAVDSAAVRSSAARWLDPARAGLVVVGPAARLEPILERLGPVEVVSTSSPPVAIPVRPSLDTAAARPEQRTRGAALVRQALAAHGGVERLKGIHDSVVETQVRMIAESGNEVRGSVQQVRKEPFRMVSVSSFGRLTTTQVLDRDHGWGKWSAGRDTVVEESPQGVAALRAAFSMDLPHLLLSAADTASRVAFRGREKVGSADADVIEVAADGLRRVLFLDADKHTLVAVEENDPSGLRPAERRVYGDFRISQQGILWPFSEERFLDEELSLKVQVSRVDLNRGADDDLFERPSEGSEGESLGR